MTCDEAELNSARPYKLFFSSLEFCLEAGNVVVLLGMLRQPLESNWHLKSAECAKRHALALLLSNIIKRYR